MLQSTIVTKKQELEQIYWLNKQNLKQNLTEDEKKQQGFVTWLYSLSLLESLHQQAPSIIIKEEDQVVAYALTTLKEASRFHPDLQTMIGNLSLVLYEDKPITSYKIYMMGQICVAKDYRGKGLVNMLYNKHKEVYSKQFDILLTEISTSNTRSQKAHEKIGFKTIYTYPDNVDEWNVVVWDWRQKSE